MVRLDHLRILRHLLLQPVLPEGNETTALLASFGIFAVGFFMRPVGGWLLGIFSDRYGRKAALA